MYSKSLFCGRLRRAAFSPLGQHDLERMIYMEKITSFTIDHIKLVPGVYVSRKDMAGTVW